ncbi:hypothetical protein Tco_1286878 [Tanacetum coccineum]
MRIQNYRVYKVNVSKVQVVFLWLMTQLLELVLQAAITFKVYLLHMVCGEVKLYVLTRQEKYAFSWRRWSSFILFLYAVSSIRKRLRSTTAFPNTYIERQRITGKVAQHVAHAVQKALTK